VPRRPQLGDDWRWCPRCRAPLAPVERADRRRPVCAACGFTFFANPGVGAATVVRDELDRVLLVRRPRGGRWCFPCGFVEWGEDVRAAAARETWEEAGLEVTVGEVLQVASNFHDPRKPTIGVWFAATRLDPAAVPVAGDDAAAVGWFELSALPPLAFPTDVELLRRLARVGDAPRPARRRRRHPS
jgi:ADP-ribose pyrophosphatase YjhB (NUDIX family)